MKLKRREKRGGEEIEAQIEENFAFVVSQVQEKFWIDVNLLFSIYLFPGLGTHFFSLYMWEHSYQKCKHIASNQFLQFNSEPSLLHELWERYCSPSHQTSQVVKFLHSNYRDGIPTVVLA